MENYLYRVRGKGDPPVESPGSEWTLCSLNSFSVRKLGAAGSRTDLRPLLFMTKKCV